MKRIGITLRVEHKKAYGEQWDCLDQSWSDLIFALGAIPLLLPNVEVQQLNPLLGALKLDGIILSGGNSLIQPGITAPDAAPQRDTFERALIEQAISDNIPIFGVCRGMQLLNQYFGGGQLPVEGHVAERHDIISLDPALELPATVNSFHQWGIPSAELADSLEAVALDQSERVEALVHREKNIAAMMWHPEREQPFNPLDIQWMKSILCQ